MTELEHLKVTVKDTHATAEMLCDLSGWGIPWEGASINDGYSLHVGSKTSYLALYSPKKTQRLLPQNTTVVSPSTT